MPVQTGERTEEQHAVGSVTSRAERAIRHLPQPHLPHAAIIHGTRHGADGRHATVRARPAAISASLVALAGLQLLLGYEWLLSGMDKLLYGQFPQQLGALLAGQVSAGRLPGFFAGMLQALVLPNAGLFGVLIEWGETLAGLGLVAAGGAALLHPTIERRLKGRLRQVVLAAMRLSVRLAPAAAAGAGLLGLSFFLLDGTPSPFPQPSIAYGGALDTGLFLALGSTVLLTAALLRRKGAHSR